MSSISSNILAIQQRIDSALTAAGRPAGAARLLAVTKTFPASVVQEAYDAGLRAFGENRVQELVEKAPQLPSDIAWHVIGHLQQNKVRHALTHAAWIHSVDTPELLDRINRIAAEEQVRPNVLIEVNISGEASKWGTAADDVESWLASRLGGPAAVQGLMTVAPADASEAELHQVFAGLRTLRDSLQTRLGIQLPELSMGMSHDFEIAIAEGATIVRVGSAIFGHRTYPEQPQGNS